ncbi:hypothetical protein K7432_015627 [Basidiobolus ranarum]|uniref:Short-chain dehydrogenase n=1 Tax=Basidiobolus ranarum TaxID=34480 RepID=A0ABR2WFX6_9FUNG
MVILGGRKQETLDDTIKKIKEETPEAKLHPLIIDLASLESVRSAAKEVNEYSEPIDVLINNAAIMASPYNATVDGFEAQFGVNHLGPFLFTNLILPQILASKTGAPRIVNVSSLGHNVSPIRFADYGFNNGRDYDKWQAYGQSKTANSPSWSDQDQSFKTRCFDAEVANVPDANGKPQGIEALKWKTIPQGSATHIVAAFDPSIKDQSGLYLRDAQVNNAAAQPYALDAANAHKLWALSEKLVGQKFD